jgi:hypothetical protein
MLQQAMLTVDMMVEDKKGTVAVGGITGLFHALNWPIALPALSLIQFLVV